MAKLNFDLNAVESVSARDVLPAGIYPARIKYIEDKITKAGTGSYTELTWEVVDGPYANRLIWDRLNLDNPKPKAVDIAQRTLKRICIATGAGAIGDTIELQDKFAMLKVKVTSSPGYSDSNEVADYAPLQAGGAPAEPRPMQQPPQQAKPAASTPPWAA